MSKFLYKRTNKLIFVKVQVDTSCLHYYGCFRKNFVKNFRKNSVFSNINYFKDLAGIFHFPNTKGLGKFEFKCLMLDMFSQMSSNNFPCDLQLFQKNSMREISQILIFARGKTSTVKISIFKVTAFDKTVYLSKLYFQIAVHEKWPVNDKWLQTIEKFIEKIIKSSEAFVR